MNHYVEMRFRGSADWIRLDKSFAYGLAARKNAALLRDAGFAARAVTVKLGRPVKAA